MQVERRTQRSNFSDQALGFWLSSRARESGLEGLVLADSSGLLVATNMAPEAAEPVAASGALMHSRRDIPESMKNRPASVCAFAIGGQELLLCTVGAAAPTGESFGELVAGVERILHGN
jgi:hypothetical protein